jgi:phage shock protein PspC (stress-responsive transcriptional regulator)
MRIRDYQDRAPGGGKLLGTCAGLEDRTGVPAIAWRIGIVAAMLLVSFKLSIAVYCVMALVFRLGRR